MSAQQNFNYYQAQGRQVDQGHDPLQQQPMHLHANQLQKQSQHYYMQQINQPQQKLNTSSHSYERPHSALSDSMHSQGNVFQSSSAHKSHGSKPRQTNSYNSQGQNQMSQRSQNRRQPQQIGSGSYTEQFNNKRTQHAGGQQKQRDRDVGGYIPQNPNPLNINIESNSTMYDAPEKDLGLQQEQMVHQMQQQMQGSYQN